MFIRSLLFSGVCALVLVASPVQAQTIVDIAQSDANFSSLVQAVVSQDLASTLSGEGPFTVFAPTNDAFDHLPEYLSDAIARNPELLTDILLYHVVADELFAGDVLSKRRIETVLGESLRVQSRHGASINNAQILATDIDATNGVVHVIDTVLIPNSVYRAVLRDLQSQLQSLVRTIRDVRVDQIQTRW